jgi:hypothetical protein
MPPLVLYGSKNAATSSAAAAFYIAEKQIVDPADSL